MQNMKWSSARSLVFVQATFVPCAPLRDRQFQWYDIIKYSFILSLCQGCVKRFHSTSTLCPHCLILCASVCWAAASEAYGEITGVNMSWPDSVGCIQNKSYKASRAARTKQISTLVVPFLSFGCYPERNSLFIHPQSIARATFSFVLMNLGM